MKRCFGMWDTCMGLETCDFAAAAAAAAAVWLVGLVGAVV
jgi:hypothetical protein